MPVVLITREHAEPLASLLARHGVDSVHLPMSRLQATRAAPPCAHPPKQGVVVTSAAVSRLAPEAVSWMQGVRVVAVGEATGRSLQDAGLEVVLAGGTGASALARVARGACFVGARQPAPAMTAAIASGRVLHWPVYARVPSDLTTATLPKLQAVCLASPSAARSWAALGLQNDVPVAVIGPTTSAAAREAGLVVGAVAERPSMEALARATAELSRRPRG